MWVSTNKVLIGSVGGPKKTHLRNPNFDFEETKLLISLWGDPQVQKTLVTSHKKHPVIAQLAEKMREYGYNRSPEEVNTRIKNVKCFYNRVKKDHDAGIVTSWKHFQAMDEIMSRPIFGNNHQQSSSEAGPSNDDNASTDQVQVKLEPSADDDKEIRTEELLKNAEQIELKEPNLLIPKDEPMDEDDDDPNDPDFENDGDDEDDSISDDSDESDFDIDDERRKARLRRRTSRKLSKANTQTNKPTSTPVTSSAVVSVVTCAPTTTMPTITTVPTPSKPPGTIKIINYTGNSGINISTIVPNQNMITQSSGQNVTIVPGAANTTSTTPGKISLVPTNFLLKPQAPKINFNSPIQLYTKPTVSIANNATISAASTPASSAVQPMKLLFVNTAGSQKQQIITPSKHIYTTTPTPLVKTTPATQIAIQPKPVITSTTSLMAIPQKKPDPPPPVAVAPAAPKKSGIKSLLGQLVSIQRENLALSRSRINVERERFNNEKQIVCSLVEALNDLNNMLQGFSSTVNIGDDFGCGTPPPATNESDGADSRMNDISQEMLPVSGLIPVVDTIKAEVISDSD
ncbi:AAEL013730-PA [Aedes aegypti]|uniref:AAEL013730-PA n=1 Tax=Aedes aegypti TaxID=7159 RepID=Q16IB7_AEDAE|nr:AAEL013730-PA [Aedes aegypti]